MKRGVFFSADALIALIIIFLIIIVAFPKIQQTRIDSRIDQDILETLSSLKVGETSDPVLQSLISQRIVTDMNKSILDQLGELYVTDPSNCQLLGNSILSNLETKENVGIWFENNLIASKNTTSMESSEQIDTTRQVISGIREGESLTGFSARGLLTSSSRSKYFYFGGYVGDGNITAQIEYDGTIDSATIELAINDNFALYINGNYIDTYEKSADQFTPISYTLPTDDFISGNNTVQLKGDDLFIAGGYIKIAYTANPQYAQPETYQFPGIQGKVNLYDGFYIPEDIQEIDISLHIKTNYTLFLNVGNQTVYHGETGNQEQTISIPDSSLSSLLDYDSLERKTVPLRLGIENVSYFRNLTDYIDTFSVTDLSGSMDECGAWPDPPLRCRYYCLFGDTQICEVNDVTECTGNVCGGSCFYAYGHSILEPCANTKLELALEANKLFVNEILNISGSRVGLAGYSQSAPDSTYHSLSDDNESLIDEINTWEGDGATCICCGINKAKEGLVADSSPTKTRSMVVMSDGEANVQCGEQGTGNAKQDAIQAACDAFQDEGIIVNTVGFGPDADATTLQAVAACGNGTYYYANLGELLDVYQNIIEDIIKGVYIEQSVEIYGDFYSELYPDSYISFTTNSSETPYGLTITNENQFYAPALGQFEISNDSTFLEGNIVSYSGSRWTDNVKLNSQNIYSIADYGTNYTALGDPYSVEIPSSFVQSNNSVEVVVGSSPSNTTSGSEYDKIIYTVLKQSLVYSPITSYAEGCDWQIEFEDGSMLNATIPTSYTGGASCYYTAAQVQYDSNDAIQAAVYNLLYELDLNKNNKVDIKFSAQDLEIDVSEITGIPFPWSTEVEIRRWV